MGRAKRNKAIHRMRFERLHDEPVGQRRAGPRVRKFSGTSAGSTSRS